MSWEVKCLLGPLRIFKNSICFPDSKKVMFIIENMKKFKGVKKI